jgi:hypothetical protein
MAKRRTTKTALRSKRAGSEKKRGPGRPVTTGKGELVGLRCHKPFLEAVDSWRDTRELSRPAAIVRLAEVGLKAEGHDTDATG